MSNRDVLAIGTSAGGVAALLFLAERLPPDFPATILVTLHLSAHCKSSLDEIVDRVGPLRAKFAADGEPIARGTIYLAPPDRHLLVEDERLWLGTGPRENNSRPAIDPMLRSVAACCGGRAIGVVLTGTLGDGASGLWAVGECGGRTVVQDPQDAAFSEMPLTALQSIRPNHIAALPELPDLLNRLVREPAGEQKPVPPGLAMELMVARGEHMSMEQMDRIGRRSYFACPECHGVMWEIDEGELVRYRCHVGHAYTAELMGLAMDDNLRRAMASALRALEERVALARKLEREADARQQPYAAAEWKARADEFQQELNVIEGAIQRMDEITALAGQSPTAPGGQPAPLFRAVSKG